MKGNSHKKPDKTERIGKHFQVRWNITKKSKKFEDETLIYWEFEYINIEKLERSHFIREFIKLKYPTYADEIAIINNKEDNEAEYLEYQAHRNLAKQLADEMI